MDFFDLFSNPLGTAFNVAGSLFASNKDRKMQQYLQHDAQEFTRQEREAMQGYQTNERLAAQEYNTGEREAAQQWEFEQWNRTNRYNTPAAQLQRMMDAGINPNAAFGGMSSVAADSLNTQGSSISPQSAASGESGVGSMPAHFDNFGAAIAEGVNNSFRNMLANAQAKKTGAETKLTQKEIDKVLSEVAKTDAETEQLKLLTPVLVGKNEAEIKSLNAAINIAHQQLETEKQNTRLRENEANNASAQGEVIKEQADQLGLQNKILQVSADLAKQGIIADKGFLTFVLTSGFSLWNRLSRYLSGLPRERGIDPNVR